MASASQKQVARAANGQFRPGVSGNLSGNVHRSRHALNSETIREMHVAFRRGGRKAIDHVMKQQPKVEHSNAIKDLTDEQLEAMIEYLKASLEAKAQGTNVTGGEVLDAAALPAPETTGPAPDVVLDDKPKQPNKVMEAANTAIGPMRALRTTRAPSTLREILEAEK